MPQETPSILLIPEIPLDLFQRTDAAALGAAVAANPDGTYAGARATVNIFNFGTKVALIEKNSIIVNCAQRHEIVVFAIWTGQVAAVNRNNIISYQRGDADEGTVLLLPRIILKPGQQLIFDVYNRAPAAAADVTSGVPIHEIEARIYDRFISRQRHKLELDLQTI